jgi:predicted DNA-binding helix-hairpin-helix protein
MREHRLYQADWLLRQYGFSFDEVAAAAPAGMLDLAIDPKLAWALRHRERFPVDVNTAPREALLRVPGLGVRAVTALLKARRHGALRLHDLARLTSSVRKIRPFVATPDWHPGSRLDGARLAASLRPPVQLGLFAA